MRPTEIIFEVTEATEGGYGLPTHSSSNKL